MTFGVLKAGVCGCLSSKVSKFFSKGMTKAAVDIDTDTAESLRLRATEAVLSAIITATTPVLTGKAFYPAGINSIDDKIKLNPWALAKHFFDPQEELFTIGLYTSSNDFPLAGTPVSLLRHRYGGLGYIRIFDNQLY